MLSQMDNSKTSLANFSLRSSPRGMGEGGREPSKARLREGIGGRAERGLGRG